MYKKDSKDKDVNDGALSIVEKFRLEPKGLQSDEDLQLRMVSRFINEAILCLEEGLLNGPVSIFIPFSPCLVFTFPWLIRMEMCLE